MPLSKQAMIGLGGAAALIGYLIWSEKKAKAAPIAAKHIGPTPPPYTPPIPTPIPYTPPPEKREDVVIPVVEMTEAEAYVPMYTDEELSKDYASGKDISKSVGDLRTKGYNDGNSIGYPAGKADAKKKKNGQEFQAPPYHPALMARMNDSGLSTPYKDGFSEGFTRSYEGGFYEEMKVAGVGATSPHSLANQLMAMRGYTHPYYYGHTGKSGKAGSIHYPSPSYAPVSQQRPGGYQQWHSAVGSSHPFYYGSAITGALHPYYYGK